MLARITYAVLAVAIGTLIGGFFTDDSNVLLFISIGLSVVVIVLVVVGWMQRAREAPAVGYDEEAEEELEEDEGVLSALDSDELAFVEERAPRSRRKTPAKRSAPKSKPKSKASKPKPKSKSKPKSKAKASKSKAKPKASKSKAKPKASKSTRKKAKPSGGRKGGAGPSAKRSQRRPRS